MAGHQGANPLTRASGAEGSGPAALEEALAAEQSHLDATYARIEDHRAEARAMVRTVEVGRGGTEQARVEHTALLDNVSNRLRQLDVGDEALCFGRLDFDARGDGPDDEFGVDKPLFAETFHIGRLALSGPDQEPLLVDWRAPVAEPFYRATGGDPMGLARRRHLVTRDRRVLGIEDELFGRALAAAAASVDGGDGTSNAPAVSGEGALFAALESGRTGRLGDIVATIQGEQDEIIRAPLPGIHVVQGGPGTGKTVVALHRAAYLIYTHRFPLEDQGVLVLGPSRLFLGYVGLVLPSLGEAGVRLAVLGDLIGRPDLSVHDDAPTARTKGHPIMADVLAKAVRDRERALRAPLRIGFGLSTLELSVEQSRAIVRSARRRFRSHNRGRRFVEREVFDALAASSRQRTDGSSVRHGVRRTDEVRAALEWMWPVLTPEQLLRDLFGSRALLRSAGQGRLDDAEQASLHRPRGASVDEIEWTLDDAPLLDEASTLLGSKQGAADLRTYGHIIVDEAQDLSPMALRMLDRRSLNGSMTLVGDMAQATAPWQLDSWSRLLEHLSRRRPPVVSSLTLGYRVPESVMEFADRVRAVAAPEVEGVRAVRRGTEEPQVLSTTAERRDATVLDQTREAVAALSSAGSGGRIAIIATERSIAALADLFEAHDVAHGIAPGDGLNQAVTLVPASIVKGLEVDTVIVVEPGEIVDSTEQGLRTLYVALTRPTRSLVVVHAAELPDCLVTPSVKGQPSVAVGEPTGPELISGV